MYFQWHDYQHPANEVDVTMITQQRMYSPRNQMVFIRKTLTMQGHFCATGQATIKETIDNLEDAYLAEWHTVGLYHDDGSPSAHVLDFDTSLNGIRLLTLDYPKEEGGEYATGRSYRAVFQADYARVSTLESEIYSWSETLTLVGTGGMDWELIPQFMGPPVFQINAMMTPQHVIQSGENIGVTDYVEPPKPYFPLYCHENRSMVERDTCQKKGRHWSLLWPSRWKHFMTLPPGAQFPLLDGPVPAKI